MVNSLFIWYFCRLPWCCEAENYSTRSCQVEDSGIGCSPYAAGMCTVLKKDYKFYFLSYFSIQTSWKKKNHWNISCITTYVRKQKFYLLSLYQLEAQFCFLSGLFPWAPVDFLFFSSVSKFMKNFSFDNMYLYHYCKNAIIVWNHLYRVAPKKRNSRFLRTLLWSTVTCISFHLAG